MRQCDLTEKYFQGSFGHGEAHLVSLCQRNLVPLQRQAVCRRRRQDEDPFPVDGTGARLKRVIRHGSRYLPLQRLRRPRRTLLCRARRFRLQWPRRPGLCRTGWPLLE